MDRETATPISSSRRPDPYDAGAPDMGTRCWALRSRLAESAEWQSALGTLARGHNVRMRPEHLNINRSRSTSKYDPDGDMP